MITIYSTVRPKVVIPRAHHVGIQTENLDSSVEWYCAFLGCEVSWSIDQFSPLTMHRLPGIKRLVEVAVGGTRIHLFERSGRPAPRPKESVIQFQHVCLAVDHFEDLPVLRDRWTELFESGRFHFAVDEPATEIVVDSGGVHSFYAYDVNGLEFEFMFDPGDHQ